MVSKVDDGKFMLSNFYKVFSFIKKGQIVSFLKLIIYLSIYFDERQKEISHLYIYLVNSISWHNIIKRIFMTLCVAIILVYDIYNIDGLIFTCYIPWKQI